PPDEDLQMGCREGLRQVIPGARALRFHARLDRWVSGHHHDEGDFVRLKRRRDDLGSGHRRHEEVTENDLELAASDEIDRLVAASGGRHIVTLYLQRTRTALTQSPVVVDDQDTNRCSLLWSRGEDVAHLARWGSVGRRV